MHVGSLNPPSAGYCKAERILHLACIFAILKLTNMTRFRPCIDLHAGQVKQIVGGTLDSSTTSLQTNFVSSLPPAHFSRLYREGGLTGAHVIMLGPGNEAAAREALQAWPGGLQVGGGIKDTNAREWVEAGAEKVGGERGERRAENSLISRARCLGSRLTWS